MREFIHNTIVNSREKDKVIISLYFGIEDEWIIRSLGHE